MRPTRLLLLACLPASLSVACGSQVIEAAGGTATTSSSSSSSSTSSSSSSSSTSSSSSSSSTSSSSSSSSSTSSSSSGGGQCPSLCTSDLDCASCPATGDTFCCDTLSGLCYVASTPTCPVPPPECQEGTVCAVGEPDCQNSLFCGCTCDDTGHRSCQSVFPQTTCPSVAPKCGDPCPPGGIQTCLCDDGGGNAVGCECVAGGTWLCGDPMSICPPNTGTSGATMLSGQSCAAFPVDTYCPYCTCVADCGTQVWTCFWI